ncbi:beta strand repeat-containing protein, partial [Stenoxybacter acetivorans]|uniref:beta strand repeat-containing protein n=1 Tax=Stenoxybacter acetivorans TaxID=422441 RepID=UPI00056067BF
TLNIANRVNNQNGLISSAQNARISDSGKNTLVVSNDQGGIVAGKDFTLQAKSYSGSGQLAAGQNLSSQTQDFGNSGLTAAGSTLTLRNQNALTNSGEINAAQVDIVSGSLSNAGGKLIGKEISLNSQSINNTQGQMDAERLTASSQSLDNSQGAIRTNEQLTLNIANRVNNQHGLISSAQNARISDSGKNTLVVSNDQGGIVAGKDFTLQAKSYSGSGQLAAGQNLSSQTQDFGNSGLTAAGSILTLRNQNALTNSGEINATQVDIVSNSLSNAGGKLIQSGGQDLRIRAATLTNGGVLGYEIIPVKSSAAPTAGQQAGTAGTGTTQAGKQPASTADNDSFTGAMNVFTALPAGQIIIGEGLNNQGEILANGDTHLSVTQNLLNRGQINVGELHLDSGILDNRDAQITASIADITAVEINNRRGKLTVDQDLRLHGNDLDNRGGVLHSSGTAQLQIGGINNSEQGIISAAGNMSVQSEGLNNRQGNIVSNGQARIGSRLINNTDGTIDAQSLNITAADIDNRHGHIRAGQMIDAQISNSVDNRYGQLSSTGDIRLHDNNSNTLIVNNQNGSISAVQDVRIQSGDLKHDTSGTVAAGRDLNIALKNDINTQTDYTAGRNLILTSLGSINNQHRLQGGSSVLLTANNISNQASGVIESADHTELNAKNHIANEGLINSGGNSWLHSGNSITNHGSGRIYGDHIAIGGKVLNNIEEDINGKTQSAVIAARERLDIGVKQLNNLGSGADKVVNGEWQLGGGSSLILSLGSLHVGGALDTNGTAKDKAQTLINRGGRIESIGDMYLSAAQIHNLNNRFEIEKGVETDSRQEQRWSTPGSSEWYIQGKDGNWRQTSNHAKGRFDFYDGRGSIEQSTWRTENVTITRHEDKLKHSEAGQIIAGGDLHVDSKQLLNENSQILIGGDWLGSNKDLVLENKETQAQVYEHETGSGAQSKAYKKRFKWRRKNTASWSVDRENLVDEKPFEGFISYQEHINTGGKQNIGDSNIGTVGQVLANGAEQTGTAARQGNHTGLTRSETQAGTAAAQQNQTDSIAAGQIDGIRIAAETADKTIRHTNPSADTAKAKQDNGAALKETQSEAAIKSGSGENRVDAQTQNGQDITVGGTSQTQQQAQQSHDITQAAAKTVNGKTVLPGNSLYHINPNPGGYLVETDPAFTNHRRWLGSDYMLQQLQLDPQRTQKRLGDAFYEQRLINEQIAQLTGYRRLSGYQSDEEQFKALMDNGASIARQFNLTPGIALSAAQMAQLTSDIVWLVSEQISLPGGGTQTVLVPKVYLKVREGDLNANGSLISANNIQLNLGSGSLNNQGTIAGRNIVHLQGENLRSSGLIQGSSIALQAQENIVIHGGQIHGTDSVNLSGSRIDIASVTKRSGDAINGGTNITRVAGIYIDGGAESALNLIAEKGITIQGAALVNNQGSSRLYSQNGNISIGTVAVNQSIGYGDLNDKNHLRIKNESEVGSQIYSGGNLSIGGGQINIRQSELNSEQGRVYLYGSKGVQIESGIRSTGLQESVYSQDKDIGKKTTEQDQYQNHTSQAVSSNITGNSILIGSGKDINIIGSNIVSDRGTQLAANGSIVIEAAENRSNSSEWHETKKSGIMGGGGLGVFIGKKQDTINSDGRIVDYTGSQVGSLQGNTVIQAGKDYTQIGSTVSAPEGTVH